jgi:VWFA-related protein
MAPRGSICFAPAVLLLLSSAAAVAQSAPPTFKAETNLVLVPVVVRDAKGEVVANLGKEDFHLFDNGKEREITSFSLEETSGHVAADRSESPAGAAPMVMPAHYVALMFDDVHIGDYGDLTYTRNAVRKFLDKLQPADRVAFFTVSGFTNVDFTADRAKIVDAMMKLGTGPSGFYGMDDERLAITTIVECDKIVSRMALLPGQRTFVFLSASLIIHTQKWTEVPRAMRMIDHAIRSRVVIDGLDTLGLSMIPDAARLLGWEFQLITSDGTGGKFIRDTNDLDGAVEQLAATPKYIYILGFSPGNIKPDGSLHRLTVKLRQGIKLDVQARSGYAAPEVMELTRRGPAPADPAPQLSEAEGREVAQALGITNPV